MDSAAYLHLKELRQRPSRTASGLNLLTRKLKTLSLSPQGQESEDTNDVRGQLGLNLLFSPSEPIVDFIFVHGLRGGSRKTWSKSSHPFHFWPKEWLPVDPDFKAVRIHSFGYNADWGDRRQSILNVHDFAQSLLGELHDSRHIRKDPDLPLVFVAHSMGGLVVKKAYLLARQDPAFQHLGDRFHTMFFLATPHRGSDSASLLANLLKLSHGSKPYLKDLQENSPSTQSINDDFRHVSGNLRLRSFYETLPTNIGVNSVIIVDRNSAVLGYSNEQADPLDANHRDVCKFNNPSDTNFRRLRNSFVSTIDEVMDKWITTKSELIKEQRRCLESFLGIAEKPEDDLAAVECLRTEDSCEWLTSNEPFRTWLKDESVRIFWLTAKPATGKSILAGHVINHLENQNKDCSYYFFNHGKKATSDLARCLRSMAYQMALLNPNVRERLVAMQKDGVQYDKDNFQFIWRKIFLGAIFAAEFQQPHYWIIDALDECQNSAELEYMLCRIEESFPLKIFITSRSLSEDRKRTLETKRKIRFESISLEHTENDIKLFVTANMHRLPLDDEEEAARSEMVNTILEKSFGCFLWVRLIIEQLVQVFSSADVRKVLREAPKGMDSLYSRILDTMSMASFGKPLARAILTWTVCAARPLTIEELKYALQLDVNDKIYSLTSAIASSCEQLVYVDPQSRVHMVHQTARDFVLKLDCSSEFAIDLEAGHRRLATTCLKYLLGTEMRAPFSRRRSSGNLATKRSQFADYVCTAFYEHVRQTSSVDDDLFFQLGAFLDSPQILSWIEYVAQNGNLNHLIRTGKILKSYVERRVKHKLILGKEAEIAQNADAWGTDLIRIVARFGTNLLNSPSSIFWLIPSFCPSGSALHKQFGDSPRNVVINGLSAKIWDDRLSCIIYDHRRQPSAIACDDNIFAVGLSNGAVEVHHMMTCQRLKTFQHGESIKVLEFSPSSRLLASAGRRYVRVWNVVSGTQLWCFDISQQCLALAFTDDEKTLLAAMRDNCLVYRELATGSEIRKCPWFDEKDGEQVRPQRPPTHVAISLELKLLGINYRGRLILWDLENDAYFGFCGKEYHNDCARKLTTTSIMDLVFNPAPNTALLAAAYQDGSLALFDPIECTTKHVTSKVNAQTLASSPDGRTLASGDSSGTIQLFEFDTLKLMYRLNSNDVGIKAFAFSSDSLRFIDIRGPQCNIWGPAVLVRPEINDERSAKASTAPNEVQVEELDEIVTITTVVCYPSGEYIFCGKDNGAVSVYSSETGRELQQLYSHTTGIPVVSLLYEKDNKFLVSADSSSRILMYKVLGRSGKWKTDGPVLDIQTEQAISQLVFINNPSRLLVSSPNSDSLFTMTGQFISQSKCEPRRAWSWAQLPNHAGQLALISDKILRIFASQDLAELTRPEGIHLGLEDLSDRVDVKSFMSYCDGTLLGIEFCQLERNRSTTGIFLWETARLTPDTTSVSPALQYDSLVALPKHVIGANGGKMFFLDLNGWVSSVDLSAFAGHMYLRYFFVPSDWLSTCDDLIFQVTTRGDFIFVRRDELAVIKRGLEIGEMTPLKKGA